MTNITTIRREVATIANRLNKQYNNLSISFKIAWKVIKSGINTNIKGVTFGLGQKILQRLSGYSKEQIIARLECDCGNKYDENAVAVVLGVEGKGTVKAGYVDKSIAKIIAPVLDKGIEIKTLFMGVIGGFNEYVNYGGLINLQFAV